MVRKTATLTTVFADVSGSTSLYEELGDVQARELVAQCLELMTECVSSNNGRVVKSIGDEVMCIFTTAQAAVQASIAMQEAVTEELPRRNPSTPRALAIRIGLHHGPVIAEGGDVFGDAVNIASRMASMAKAEQIITTEATVELLPQELKNETRHLDRIQVQGKAEELDVFEVVWQPEDVTRIATDLLRQRAGTTTSKLLLRYRNLQQSLDANTVTFVLGRGRTADMVIEDSMASREHCRIECRRGRFFIVDQSTNGTYVQTAEGVAYLRRDEMQVNGKGKIALGRSPVEATEVVLFALTE